MSRPLRLQFARGVQVAFKSSSPSPKTTFDPRKDLFNHVHTVRTKKGKEVKKLKSPSLWQWSDVKHALIMKPTMDLDLPFPKKTLPAVRLALACELGPDEILNGDFSIVDEKAEELVKKGVMDRDDKNGAIKEVRIFFRAVGIAAWQREERLQGLGKDNQSLHTERKVDKLAWNLCTLAGFNTESEGFEIDGRRLTLKIGGVECENEADVYVASLMDPTTNKLVIVFEDKMTGDGNDYTESRIKNTTVQLIAEMISLEFVNTRDLPDHTPGEVYCVRLMDEHAAVFFLKLDKKQIEQICDGKIEEDELVKKMEVTYAPSGDGDALTDVGISLATHEGRLFVLRCWLGAIREKILSEASKDTKTQPETVRKLTASRGPRSDAMTWLQAKLPTESS
eukprot:TRINITY_DN1474_c0_g1_i1.p1 TRINITY_DN1474_c0_g1~~TRINITY_DN1474_c0_g1_i1.p1  ORF type:complete len:411 (+),score=82.53 TRINITY_DN1474_c0_g1_i1:52-1233(+)